MFKNITDICVLFMHPKHLTRFSEYCLNLLLPYICHNLQFYAAEASEEWRNIPEHS